MIGTSVLHVNQDIMDSATGFTDTMQDHTNPY
jgi:hypothetical protein